MVRQYPYVLQVLELTGGGFDSNGNPIPPSETWMNLTRCRDEAGNGKKVTLNDGNVHEYAFLIQMPKGVEAIQPGKKVRVMDGADVRARGEVVYSRRDQLHSRAWV